MIVAVVVLAAQGPDSPAWQCRQGFAVGTVVASLRSRWQDRATRLRVIDAAEERIRRNQGLPTASRGLGRTAVGATWCAPVCPAVVDGGEVPEWDEGPRRCAVEWLVGVAAVVLTGVVLVGLFVGPSHRPACAPPAESDGPPTAPLPVPSPDAGDRSSDRSTTKAAYQLPPAANRLEDRTRLATTHARRRSRTRS